MLNETFISEINKKIGVLAKIMGLTQACKSMILANTEENAFQAIADGARQITATIFRSRKRHPGSSLMPFKIATLLQ